MITPEQRKKGYARGVLNEAVARGKIKKLSCSVCGEENVEGHHTDYDKPFDVIWLCRKHHAAEHQRTTGWGMGLHLNNNRIPAPGTEKREE